MRTDKPLKSVERWISDNPHLVEEHWIEEDCAGEDNQGRFSYWIYLKPGWINWMTEAHIIHEGAARDVIEHASYIRPCNCEQCTETLKGELK